MLVDGQVWRRHLEQIILLRWLAVAEQSSARFAAASHGQVLARGIVAAPKAAESKGQNTEAVKLAMQPPREELVTNPKIVRGLMLHKVVKLRLSQI